MTVDQRSRVEGLSALEGAVLHAIAYSDVFDYPVTAEEICRVLPFEATAAEVKMILTRGLLGEQVTETGSFYTLTCREALVELRQRRKESSRQLLRQAHRYGVRIDRLPFVRMVAVTGSLAVSNADEADDIDYLIVTARGRVWLARALTMIVVRLAALRGVTLCPNYLLSETALALPQRDIYTARELLQMVPVAGRAVHQATLAANGWCRELLPNWTVAGDQDTGESRSALATLGERLLSGRLGDALERWLLRRKGGELRRQAGDNSEAVFDETMCKGHFDAHAARLRDELSQRLKGLGLQP
jgi:nucleotide-binding universal stress UspA family protein